VYFFAHFQVQMKGSVQYKKDRRKYYPVIYDNETKKHKWGTGHRSQKEAERELRTLLRKYDTGVISFGRKDTAEAVYQEFDEMVIPERYESEGQRRTVRGNFQKHILPVFGKVRVDQIQQKDVQRLMHTLTVDKTIVEGGKKKRIPVWILNLSLRGSRSRTYGAKKSWPFSWRQMPSKRVPTTLPC
jgi:hypothetical protein